MLERVRLSIEVFREPQNSATRTSSHSSTFVKMVYISRQLQALKQLREGMLPRVSRYYQEFRDLDRNGITQRIAVLTQEMKKLKKLQAKDDLKLILDQGHRVARI